MGSGGSYHGWPTNGCSVTTDWIWVDVIMVGLRMDALRERMESGWTLSGLAHGFSARTDGVRVDVVMDDEGACDFKAAGDVCPVNVNKV